MTNSVEKRDKVTVLFACIHNAGRSYAAHSIATKIKTDNITIISAGTDPQDEVNPAVTKALEFLGYQPINHSPTLLTPDEVKSSDYVVTMGCGETCPIYRGRTYLDWELEDPAGKSEEQVLEIIRQVEKKVISLIESIKSN